MTKQDMEIKMNGWTFEETVKTAENLMESEKNMFKWDVLRHLRDFAELFFEELRQYRKIGTPEECRAAVEKQKAKKPEPIDYKKYMDSVKNAEFLRGAYWCPNCNHVVRSGDYCNDCGQKLDWGDVE